MNTTENNKIIAEFLTGIKADVFHLPQFQYYTTEGVFKDYFTFNQLEFHSDWNWLMEVVEKIESLDINQFAKQLGREDITPIEGKFYLSVYDCQAEFLASVYYWQHDNDINGLKKVKGETKIQAVYNACLEFIKWHNEQKN